MWKPDKIRDYNKEIEQLKAEIARLRSALRVTRDALANIEDEIFINLTISPENEQ